ncbi:MAG: tetratricopeptide repeat protein [Symploca sp. SIO1C2]|nr:tetratricopeptide repeat protein [Symploca sp. SIO1C2]
MTSPLLSIASEHLPVRVETQTTQSRANEILASNSVSISSLAKWDFSPQPNPQLTFVAQAQANQDRADEALQLYQKGTEQLNRGQFREALATFEQVLVIVREISDRKREWLALNQIGRVYDKLGQYQQALDYYQRALAIAQEIGDRAGEGTTLNNFGVVYGNLGQYQQALNYHQQALVIRQEIGDRAGEGTTFNNLGFVYDNLGQYQQALDYYQRALLIRQEIGDRAGEGTTLNNLGVVHHNLGQYQQALDYYQQALAIHQEIGNRAGEGTTLNNLGFIYDNLGEYQQALDYDQKALAIRKETGDRAGEGTTLNHLGFVYDNLGEYQQALDYYQRALAIRQEIGDRAGEGTTLNNFGIVYGNLGQYQQALDYYQRALAIRQEIGDRAGEGTTLNNLGFVYDKLGQYQQALDYYQRALLIRQEIGDRAGEGTNLNNLGLVYDNLGQYQQALDYYQQALAIRQEIGDRAGEGTTFNNLGAVYDNLGQYQQTLDYYQQALVIAQAIGDRSSQGNTLNNLGTVYQNLGEYQKALDYYQQSLAIKQEIGNREGEGNTLSNIGLLLETQKQPELAIIFFKQSVNVREAIREGIKTLPTELQQSYTETVDHTYRSLADLLLKQNRVLEAQQVLDLLKVQELEDYLRGVRGTVDEKVENLPPEQEIIDKYTQLQNQAIAIGKELTQLRQIPSAQLTPNQKQRLTELDAKQRQIARLFSKFQQRPDIVALVKQLSTTAKEQSLQLGNLRKLSNNLQQLQQNAVLLYPLILEDRLELVLATPNSPPINRTVPVKREELNRTIVQFRQALEKPTSDAITPARQLYDWLIKPLENDLTTAEAQTIIYAPDGQLRYIPLAALHDGEQWLIERFRVNNITAASIDDLNTQPQSELSLLAAAFAQGKYNIQAGKQQFSFSGLPFAGKEVENLATTIPSTTKLVDDDFSKAATLPQMDSHSVVHFATHAAFVPGSPDDSFILFGNGDYVTLGEVREEWFFTNVDLIVLSACDTGVGGMGNGEEILGFGYLMQNAGARAAIASLWSVSDGGTQALMNSFYGLLTTGKHTKAEALRQAQIALITGDYSAVGDNRGSLIVEYVGSQLPPDVSKNLNHPYYWAPFILIGNGL